MQKKLSEQKAERLIIDEFERSLLQIIQMANKSKGEIKGLLRDSALPGHPALQQYLASPSRLAGDNFANESVEHAQILALHKVKNDRIHLYWRNVNRAAVSYEMIMFLRLQHQLR